MSSRSTSAWNIVPQVILRLRKYHRVLVCLAVVLSLSTAGSRSHALKQGKPEGRQASAKAALVRSIVRPFIFPLQPVVVTALPAVPVAAMVASGDTLYLDCGVVVSAVSKTTGALLWNRAVRRLPGVSSLQLLLALPEGVLVLSDNDKGQSELVLLSQQSGETFRSWPIAPTAFCRTEAGAVFCLLGHQSLSRQPDALVELDITAGSIKQEIPLTPGHWTQFEREDGPTYDLRAFRLGEITGTGGWLFVQGANTLITLSPDGKLHGLRYVTSFVPAIAGPAGTVLVGDRGALRVLDKRLLDKPAPKPFSPPAASFSVGTTWEPVLTYQNGIVVRGYKGHLDAFDIFRHRPLWNHTFPDLDTTYRPLSAMPLIAGGSVFSVVNSTFPNRHSSKNSSAVKAATSQLAAYSLRTGREQWTFPLSRRLLTLLVHESHLYTVQIGADGVFLTRFDNAPTQKTKVR